MVVKVVQSGSPLYKNVEIFDTVLEHIKEDHPETYDNIHHVIQLIETPSVIHKSKTHKTSVVIVSDEHFSTGGDPLRVIVKNVEGALSVMPSAHYSSSKDQGEVLWKKGGGDE
jgi:hypothetical protein